MLGIQLDSINFNKSELKYNFERSRRIAAAIEKFIFDMDSVLYFRFPLFSSICFTVFTLIYLSVCR